jgi:thiol-disulfide isomerase/thioredoxin
MMRWLRLIGAAACFLSAALVVIAAGLPERAPYVGALLPDGSWAAPEIGAVAPDLRALTLDGSTFILTAERGQPLVINFWATWCIPCALEMPDLYALASAGVTVIAVNLSEAPALASSWLAERSLTPNARFIVALDLSGEIAARYQLRGQPTTFILAPDGRIAHIFFGATTYAALSAALAPFTA